MGHSTIEYLFRVTVGRAERSRAHVIEGVRKNRKRNCRCPRIEGDQDILLIYIHT